MTELDTSRDIEKTLAIIKPDAVKKGYHEEIMERIVLEGFTIIRAERLLLSKERASLFYKEHEGKPFFDQLIDYMSSGDIYVLVLAKNDAISSWRTLMGPTDVSIAKESYPNSLRALYGTSKQENAVHGSDSVISAKREIKFFFPNMNVDPISSKAETEQYIKETLHSILVEALTKLAKEKPKDPVKWLAEYLLEHDKPKVDF